MSALPSPDATSRLLSLSEVVSRAIDWLWPGRLPLGKLAVLEGDPGLGKSLLALDLCARLSTGRPWPDGAAPGAPAASIVLNGEDGVADTIKPRLTGLGADPSRVFVVDGDDADLAVPLSLPSQTGALETLVARVQARLLVIDPIMSFFDAGVNTSSDKAIRRALAPLRALAHRRACTILLVRHLIKLARGRAVSRGLGAMGLVGLCRAGWVVGEEAGTGRRVLAPVKNNLSAPPSSLAFEVVQPEGGAAAALNWLGPSDVTADTLLAPARGPGRVPVQLPAAKAFLEEILAAGPVAVHVINKRAEEEGMSVWTLGRAKREMKVRSVRVKVDGQPVGYWALPHQEDPPATPPEDDETSLEPWLGPLREKYPGPTPLDDL